MRAERLEGFAISSEVDIVRARRRVREHACEAGLSLVDQTKLVTATSELVRNMYMHAGGGVMLVESVADHGRRGIRVTFEDRGPGIPDIDLALQDGYSTANSLGLGLPGARRLVDDFDIVSEVGRGTRVTVIRWK